MKSGLINIDIEFPIISKIDKKYEVMQKLSEYTMTKRKFIPELEKLKEYVLDSNGILYMRGKVSFLKYINIFGGFSIRFAGFGVVFVKKELDKIRSLSIVEIKEFGIEIINSNVNIFKETQLNYKKMKNDFIKVEDRDILLNYIFYLTDFHRYPDPKGTFDPNWRNKRGFVTS